jgi:hypothetical protein
MPDEVPRDLLERFVHGDDQAFESLFRLFEQEVYRWILRIVHRDARAQLVMLEAALQEPAGTAGVTLTVENGAILITPPP